jgi:uncharacterized protein with GYD domain
MTRYITLLKFTDRGARALRKSSARASAFGKAAKKAGVTVEGLYWTTGSYDGVLILRAANAQRALRCLARLAGAGNVTTETLQAFDEREFKAIVGN